MQPGVYSSLLPYVSLNLCSLNSNKQEIIEERAYRIDKIYKAKVGTQQYTTYLATQKFQSIHYN